MTRFGLVDLGNLTAMLLNANLSASDQQEALRELARQEPSERARLFRDLFHKSAQNPQKYHALLESLVELLATDPEPQATVVMLDILPFVAEAGASGGRGAIPKELRSYFYEALLTRRREDDRRVWAERLPELDADTLINLQVDRAAKSLCQSINVLKLIDNLPRRERRRALMALILNANAKIGLRAIKRMFSRPE